MSEALATSEALPVTSAEDGADLAASDPWARLADDYSEALVRVAALRADKAQHLIFGWVELYPFDMAAPDSWTAGEKPWPVPGLSGCTCTFSATKVPARRALDWYADALRGQVNVALANAKPVLAKPLNIAPEPLPGRFLLNVEAPFIMRWHDGPRIHRLVPMTHPSRALFRLSRSDKAREWLSVHLGFDPFAFEDWLGGVALVAPNPVCAAFSTFPSERGANGEETLSIQAVPRRITGKTGDLAKLSVHVIEKRGEGWCNFASLPLPADGLAKLPFPQPTGAIGHALVCQERGLLRIVEPAHRLDQIHMDFSFGRGTVDVEVPAGGRRKPADRYQVTQRAKDQTSVVGEAVDDRGADRVRELVFRRRDRQRVIAAEQKVFGIVPGRKTASIADIERKKKEAQEFISQLVARARRRLIFVDPFFGWREMRLFALRNEHAEVTPRILTGLMALKRLEGDQPGFQYQQGGVLLADLKKHSEQLGSRTPLIRVMPGGEQSIIHDRYLIVDDEVWHCGPSFNELGERLGVIVRLPDAGSIRRLVGRVWARSQSLEAASKSVSA